MSEAISPEVIEALLPEVAELIVTALNLDMPPADIEPDAPLFGEGLGLDSIDVLEISLVVSKKYGFQLKSDNEDNLRICSSLPPPLARASCSISSPRRSAENITGFMSRSLLAEASSNASQRFRRW